jgi:hypothetical protein
MDIGPAYKFTVWVLVISGLLLLAAGVGIGMLIAR